MKSKNKNVTTRTDIYRTKMKDSKNFNVTVFLTDTEKFVQDFHLCAKKTAQATLEMCKVVYEAKFTLTRDNFDSFCREIGQKSSDPTIRKYIAIGEKYDDFINYADRLPNAWTTIYNLTLIDSNTFLALVTANENFATMTAKKIKSLINASKAAISNSTQNSTIQSVAASSAASNVAASTDARDAQNDDFEADVDSDAVVDSSEIAESESQPQTEDKQFASQDAESKMSSDTKSESSEPKQSLKATSTEHLSDDFHVVIKFKSYPSKINFKNFVDFIQRLSVLEDFDLDIKLVNDVFIADSNEINQQTLQAISKIASDSELASSDLESK